MDELVNKQTDRDETAGDIIDVNTLNPSKCLSASPFYPNNNKIWVIMYARKMKMYGAELECMHTTENVRELHRAIEWRGGIHNERVRMWRAQSSNDDNDDDDEWLCVFVAAKGIPAKFSIAHSQFKCDG